MPKTWYVIFCRICDDQSGVTLPFPFNTPEERGRWAAEHTRGTGHESWLVLDQVDDE